MEGEDSQSSTLDSDIPCNQYHDAVSSDLDQLVEVFGSAIPIGYIESIYINSGLDKDKAVDILCGANIDKISAASEVKLDGGNQPPLALPHAEDNVGAISTEPVATFEGETSPKELKPKRCSAAMGTISSVICRDYAKTTPVKSELIEPKKPMKLEFKDFPASEPWSEEDPPCATTRKEIMRNDIEEFVFQMLGSGFQLDRSLICNVLGACGYDMQKSIDGLLDLSASKLGKSDDVLGINSQSTKVSASQDLLTAKEYLQMQDSAQRESTDSVRKEKDQINLGKEVLEALFTVPDRSDQAPKRTTLGRRLMNRRKTYGELVVAPIKDTRERGPPVVELQVMDETAEDNGDNYEDLRKAVKEYWSIMKEYYKAAIDAFAMGDQTKAQTLIEQGQFFNERARQAEKESSQKLFDTRGDEMMKIDLCGLDSREALKIFRLQLTTLSGIPTIKYLKFTMENDDGDTIKVQKRKKLIMKQLEKDSIKWTEEDNGKAILIQVDNLDPKRFSFAEKCGKKERSSYDAGIYF